MAKSKQESPKELAEKAAAAVPAALANSDWQTALQSLAVAPIRRNGNSPSTFTRMR
jgi:hypothetical protein